MATYGGQGQNEFSYYVGTAAETRPFSVVYNPTTNVSQVYVRTGNNLFGVPQFDPVGTINFNTGKHTLIPSTNLSASEERAFNLGVSWSVVTKEVISSASSSANPDQLLQPRGTLPEPPTPGAPADGGGSAPQPGDPDYVEGTGGNVEALTDISGEFGQEKDKALYDSWKEFLQYPEKITSSGQDRLVITQIQYVAGDLNNAQTGSLSRREEQFNKSLEKLLGIVTLPMPNDISESNQVGWGEDTLSNLGAILMGEGMKVFDPFAKGKFGEASSALSTGLGNMINNEAVGKRGKQFLLANAVASIIKKGGINVNPESYIVRATGAAINPNLELLFNGPKLRSFQFGFKMTPRSQTEARNIRAILKFFKRGMSPRRSNKAENAFFLGTPNVFRIQYKSSSSELGSIGKIKTCALTSCNINYTPDGFYAAYSDSTAGGSQPVAVTLQLGFVELTPVFSDEYNDEITVGPDQFKGMTYTDTSTGQQGAQGAQGAQGVNPLGYLGVPAPPPSPDGQPNFGLGVPPPW